MTRSRPFRDGMRFGEAGLSEWQPNATRTLFPHIGCVLIHVPKSGGSSMSHLLARIDHFFQLDGVAPKFELPDRAYYRHAKAREVRHHLPAIWGASFKLMLVRNPWAQMVSSYCWWLQAAPRFEGHREGHRAVAAMGGFEAFLASEFGRARINEARGNPEHWAHDGEGRRIVDVIAPLEAPEAILARVGEVSRMLQARALPRIRPTEHDHYSTYYTDAGVAAVRERFRWTIRSFGYRFENRRGGPDGKPSGSGELGD